MGFNENLKKELLFNDMRIKELSQKANIPYSTLISYIDKRKVIPNIEIAGRIAKALNISLDSLTSEENKVLTTVFEKESTQLQLTVKELTKLPKPLIEAIQNFIHVLYMNTNLNKE